MISCKAHPQTPYDEEKIILTIIEVHQDIQYVLKRVSFYCFD